MFVVLGSVALRQMFPWGFWRDWQLGSREVQSVGGRIIAAETTGQSINRSRVWKVRFEYAEATGGELRTGEGFTTGQKWRPGDGVQVRFLPGKNVACPVGARTTPSGWWGAPPTVLPLLGLGVCGFVVRSWRMAGTTSERGRLTKAKIAAVETTFIPANRKFFVRVTLREDRPESGLSLSALLYDKSAVAFARERMENKQSVYVLFDPRFRGSAILPEAL